MVVTCESFILCSEAINHALAASCSCFSISPMTWPLRHWAIRLLHGMRQWKVFLELWPAVMMLVISLWCKRSAVSSFLKVRLFLRISWYWQIGGSSLWAVMCPLTLNLLGIITFGRSKTFPWEPMTQQCTASMPSLCHLTVSGVWLLQGLLSDQNSWLWKEAHQCHLPSEYAVQMSCGSWSCEYPDVQFRIKEVSCEWWEHAVLC